MHPVQQARLIRNIVARSLLSMEHTSPEARKNYLHDHPNADPKDHTVDKKNQHTKESDRWKAKANKAWNQTIRVRDQVGRMEGQLDKLINGYKTHDPAKAKEVAKKLHDTVNQGISDLELCLIHAESSANLGSKDKKGLEDAKKQLNELKGTFRETGSSVLEATRTSVIKDLCEAWRETSRAMLDSLTPILN